MTVQDASAKPRAATEARLRATAWRVLSYAYHFPPREEDLSRMISSIQSARELGETRLAASLSRLLTLAQESAPADLVHEFNDLFLIPAAKYVTPYESAFVDGPEAVARRSSTIQSVFTFYRRVGFEPSRGYISTPDFIGLEFACMEHLCEREAEFEDLGDARAARTLRRIERAFLTGHLTRWTHDLCDAIRSKSTTDFYRFVGSLTREWIEAEAEKAPEEA